MMTGRALVTGSEGFVGRLLCARLAEAGIDVLGCDLAVPEGGAGRFACNIEDAEAVARLLQWAGRCDYVFHLAAGASVASGLRAPGGLMRANVEGTVNLCEAVREKSPDARMVFAGSSEVYGIPRNLPVDESHPVAPVNPYAISKLAGELYLHYLHAAHGLDVVLLRLFNHAGAGQRDAFVLSGFARSIAEMEKGVKKPVLHTGNLSVGRDFTHVEDVVRAYLLAAETGATGETYNICSGVSVPIRDALEKLRGLARTAFVVEVDTQLCRPLDVPEIRGSYAKFHACSGWQPELPFDRILEDLLNYWRAAMA